MKNKNLEKQHLLYNKVLAAIGEILSGWNITGRQLPQIFWSKWSHIKYDTPHTSDHTSDHKYLYLYLYTSQFVHVCWFVLLNLTGDWVRAVQTSGDCETSDRQDRVNIRLQDCRTNHYRVIKTEDSRSPPWWGSGGGWSAGSRWTAGTDSSSPAPGRSGPGRPRTACSAGTLRTWIGQILTRIF